MLKSSSVALSELTAPSLKAVSQAAPSDFTSITAMPCLHLSQLNQPPSDIIATAHCSVVSLKSSLEL